MSCITFIVPTVGRPSLIKTLQSIETYPGDEILLVSNSFRVADPRITYIDCPPGNDWGHTERTFATPQARCSYIAHIDDDDVYTPGARALMQDVIEKSPGRPAMFRMRFPNGITLWADKEITCGNVGTPMFLLPNEQWRFRPWEPFVGGDCKFLELTGWTADDFAWRPEITVLLGHNT